MSLISAVFAPFSLAVHWPRQVINITDKGAVRLHLHGSNRETATSACLPLGYQVADETEANGSADQGACCVGLDFLGAATRYESSSLTTRYISSEFPILWLWCVLDD
jgi:hypothetical protein